MVLVAEVMYTPKLISGLLKMWFERQNVLKTVVLLFTPG